MQKPIVLSDIDVDLASFGCSLQPEAAVSPCHASAAKKTSLYPLLIEGKIPHFYVGRSRLVDLGSVGNLFQAAKMSSHI